MPTSAKYVMRPTAIAKGHNQQTATAKAQLRPSAIAESETGVPLATFFILQDDGISHILDDAGDDLVGV